jgi:hypothetical protein
MGITDDIVTLAENKFESLLQSDDGNSGDDSDQNADDQNQKGNESDEGSEDKGGEDENQGEDQEDESEDEDKKSEEEDESEKGGDDEKSGKKGDEAPELTNEQLLAELEKRGLKVVEKDKEEKKEEDKSEPIARPEELPDKVWGKMTDVQRYIYNELPYIKAIGKDGNVLEVKTPEQIPADFEFANAQAQTKFMSDITAQSGKAEKMFAEITTSMKQREQMTNTQAESKQVVADVEQLQKEGVIPTIKAKPGTADFDKDPGVMRANEILALREERNAKGEKLSAYSAGLMYKALHPDLYKAVEAKGDQERKNVSSKVSGGGKGDQKQASKTTDSRHKYPIGMSAQDIADLAGADLE